MEALFKLIKTLTKSEKRYFKLHFNKLETKYHYLFNQLDSLKSLDRKHFAKEIVKAKKHSFKYLAVDINYLYVNLLSSLKSFHQNQSISFKIRNNLDSIEILFNKGLFEELYKLVKKTKMLIVKYEYFSFIYELSPWEYKVLGNLGGIEAVIAANAENDLIVMKLQELNELNTQYFECNLYRKTWPNDRELYETFLSKHPLESSKDLSSALAKIKLFQIHQLHAFLSNNKKQELIILDQIVACVEETFPAYRTEFTYDYVLLYSRFIYIHLELKPQVIFETLKSFILLPTKFAPHNHRLLMFVQIFALNFCLSYYIKLDAFSQAISFLNKLNLDIQLYESKVNSTFLMSTSYKIAYCYFMHNDFEQAIDQVNILLHQSAPNDNRELYEFVHLFNLLLHLELGNYELAANLMSPYKKLINQSLYWKKSGKLIFTMLKDSLAWNNKHEFDFFRKALTNFQSPENLEETHLIEKYFDIRKWLQRKVDSSANKDEFHEDIIDFSSVFINQSLK